MHLIWSILQPTIDAVFTPHLPFSHRWRLILFQPLNLLLVSFRIVPWLLTPGAYTVHHLPTRAGTHTLRTVAFHPRRHAPQPRALRPLLFLVHGGGFAGGMPEMLADIARRLSDRTGAVVVAPSYRLTPRHPFPAAIDDVDDALDWVIANAARTWSADGKNVSICGLSAGGNLAFATSMGREEVKGLVTFYAAVDMRPAPWEKPRPDNFPTSDPLSFMLELYDTYAREAKTKCPENPRCNPIFAPLDRLPRNILMQIPMIDILVHEQTVLVDRLRSEAREQGELLEDDEYEGVDLDGAKRVIKANYYEKGFHGWAELPQSVVDKESWQEAWDSAVTFIQRVQAANGHGDK